MSKSSRKTLKSQIEDLLKDIDLSKMTTKKVIQEIQKKLDLNTIEKEKEIEKLVIELMKKVANKKRGKANDYQEKKKPKKQAASNCMEVVEAIDVADEDNMNGYDSVLKKETLPKKNLPAKCGPIKSKEEEIKLESSKNTPKLNPDISDRSKSSDFEDNDKSINIDSKKVSPPVQIVPVKKTNYKRSKLHYKKKKLGPELAFLMGSESATHLEIYRKLWATIKENNLFDPSDKRFAICNGELFKIIGIKRFMTFGMMKYIQKHYV